MNNAGSRKSIRAAEKAAKRDAEADRECVASIMSTISGRAWMWRKLTVARIFDDPFSGDALTEAYSKGIRSFGMMLLADIMSHCPDEYITMTREANVRRITDEQRNATAEGSAAGEQPGSEDSGRYPERRESDDGTVYEPDYGPDEDRPFNH